jgi:hypothetical protein
LEFGQDPYLALCRALIPVRLFGINVASVGVESSSHCAIRPKDHREVNVKRDCLIVLVSISIIAMSGPKGLCKALCGADEFSRGPTVTLQTDCGAQDNKKEAKIDKSGSPRTAAKEDRKAEQIKWKLRSLGIASRVTIMLNNGNERYGSIERIDEDSFQLAEVDLKQVFTVNYGEVKKVREGYGNTNQFTGKRWNPIWAKISVVAVIVLFVVVVPLSVPRT